MNRMKSHCNLLQLNFNNLIMKSKSFHQHFENFKYKQQKLRDSTGDNEEFNNFFCVFFRGGDVLSIVSSAGK